MSKNIRKSKLKKEKQKLIDIINKSKSMKDIKGWKTTFSYHSILSKDYDWDYDFFLDLIEFKLKRMRNYFWTHNIVENEKGYGDICDKLINILHAGYKTDVVLTKDLHTKVNSRNAKRFVNKVYWRHLDANDEYWQTYGLAMIREAKAKTLFWRYLEYHIEKLWD